MIVEDVRSPPASKRDVRSTLSKIGGQTYFHFQPKQRCNTKETPQRAPQVNKMPDQDIVRCKLGWK
jgi:hypothetical protein